MKQYGYHLILVICSAALMFFTFPGIVNNFGSPFGAVFAFVPMLLVIRQAPSIRYLIPLAILFGSIASLFQFYWLAYFKEFAELTLFGTAFYYGLYQIPVFIALYAASRLSRIFRPLASACCIVAGEYLRSVGIFSFPWGIISTAASASLPLIQIADIAGIWIFSFLFSYANALILELCLRSPTGVKLPDLPNNKVLSWANKFLSPRAAHWVEETAPWHRQVLCIISLFAVVYGYGFMRLSEQGPEQTRINTVMVQSNIDPWQPGQGTQSMYTSQFLSLEGIQQLQKTEGVKPDVVIWSETAMRLPYPQYVSRYKSYPREYPFQTFLRDIDTYLLTGMPLYTTSPTGEEVAMNGAALLNHNGRVLGTYAKQHLVPFAEHLPDWDVPFMRSFYTSSVGITSTWVPGKRATVIELPLQNGKTIGMGMLICFEDSFGYLSRKFSDADVLVNISNNSWSGTYNTLIQNLAIARFRSVETRKTLIRVGNNGITGVIDPYGNIIRQIPALEEGVLGTSVPVYERYHTLYIYWGDALAQIMIALTFVVAWRFRKRQTSLRSLSL